MSCGFVKGTTRRVVVKMQCVYAQSLYKDDDATIDDLREAVTTLEDTARTARRVLGGEHPTVSAMECALRNARARTETRERALRNGSAR